MSATILLIGAGGAAQWLMRAFSPKLFPDIHQMYVMDGDEVERRNLERQDFSLGQVGKNKAVALCEAPHVKKLGRKMRITPIPSYFTEHHVEEWAGYQDGKLIVISATDNYPARTLALNLVDSRPLGSTILFSPANGYTTQEAYVYLREWQDHPMQDMRVRFPEHLTDKTDDPLSPPCDSEEALEITPQLAVANGGAALMCLNLMIFWLNEVPDLLKYVESGLKTKLIETFPFRRLASPGSCCDEKIEKGTIQ